MVDVQSKYNYLLLLANGGTLAVNNYMFWPLYQPSSGCIATCYKVSIQYAHWFGKHNRDVSPQD